MSRPKLLWLAGPGALGLLVPLSAHAQVVNGDFAQGTTAWTLTEHGGVIVPGTVVVPDERALLIEGDSFLVLLEQTFTLPLNAARLSFTFEADPGFDTVTSHLADVFEARLLATDRSPLVPTWRTGATAFFSYEEDGTTHQASGVTWDGTRVSVDVSALAVGSQATISFGLVNGDPGSATAVRVDGVVIETPNDPPVADAGDDLIGECGVDTLTLDGSGSTDPEGALLTYEWKDPSDEVLGTAPTLAVSPGLGTTTYTLTVRDPVLASASDTVDVLMEDTLQPSIDVTPVDITLEEQGDCEGLLGDYTATFEVSDACDAELEITQDPSADSLIGLDTPTEVTLTATDHAGNEISTTISVVLTDPDGSCSPPVDTADTEILVDTSDSDTADSDSGDTDLPEDTADTEVVLVATADTAPPVDTTDSDGMADTTHTDLDETDILIDETDILVGETDDDTEIDPDPFPPDTSDHDPGMFVGGPGVKGGSCACTSTGSSPGLPALGMLLLGALRRRRNRALGAALLGAGVLATAPAQADEVDYDTFGQAVVATLAVDGELDQYAFTVDPGDRIFIDIIDYSQFTDNDWILYDRWNRVIQSRDRMGDSRVLTLMGGDYRFQVFGVASNYAFAIYNVETTTETILLDTPFDGQIPEPGTLRLYELDVPSDGEYFFDVVTGAANGDLQWRVEDNLGLEFASSTTNLYDSGVWSMRGGHYTLRITSEADTTGSYTMNLVTVDDQTDQATLNTPFAGDIAHPGQVDSWEFSAAAGQCISVDVVSTSNQYNLGWILRDPVGEVVSQAPTRLEERGPICLQDGTYTFEVLGEGDATGNYEILLVEVADISGTFVLGDLVQGTIDTVGQVARYTFSASPGQRLYVKDEGSTNPYQLGFQLDHVDGRRVFDPTSSLSFHGPYVLTGGDYVLSVVPDLAATSSFRFRLVEPPLRELPTAIGAVHSDSLSVAGERLTYSFFASPGQGISLDVSQANNGHALNFYLRDTTGRLIYFDDALATSDPIYLAGGNYTLEVVGESTNTGNWTFQLADAGTTTWSALGVSTSLDVPILESISFAGEVDYYRFELTQQTRVYLDLLEGFRYLDWRLYDPAGEIIFDQDAYYDTFQNQGPFTLAPGDYTLEFFNTRDETGDYGFEIVTVTDFSGAFQQGDVVVGAIPTRGGVAAYTFPLASTERLYFDLLDGSAHLDWELIDPVGVTLWSYDSEYEGFQNTGPHVLTAGTWTLLFDQARDGSPPLSFQVVEPIDRAVTIDIGDLVSDGTVIQGDIVDYTFTAVEGQRIYLDLVDGEAYLDWALYDPAGELRWRYDAQYAAWEDVGPFTLTEGTWRLLLDPGRDSIPTWEFDLVDAQETTTSIAMDTLYTHTLQAAGERHHHTLTLAEDTRAFFDFPRSDNEIRWTLTDESGHAIWSDQQLIYVWDARGPYDLRAGTYTLTTRARDGSQPTYDFIVHTVEDSFADAEYNIPITGDTGGPGASITYTFEVEEDGLEVYFDLMAGDSDLDWACFDERGEPVFDWSNATSPDYDDQGSYRLAEGTYTLVFDPSWRYTVDAFIFRILAARGDANQLLYTRNSSTPNVRTLQWLYTEQTFLTALRTDVASLPDADGLVVAPDGTIVVAGRDEGVLLVDRETGSYSPFITPGISAHHLALAPSGRTVWVAGEPSALVEMSISPPTDGVPVPLTGDDTEITHLTWDRNGVTWYTSSPSNGIGSFGVLDMQTMNTVRFLTDYPAHTLSFDPFTGHLFIFGSDRITQWDTESFEVVSTRTLPDMTLDGGTVDGQGHALVMSNTGDLIFVDYRDTRAIGDDDTIVAIEPVDTNVDSVAPIAWLGSGCGGEPSLVDLQPISGAGVGVGPALITGRIQTPSPTRPISNVIVGGQPGSGPDATGQFWGTVEVIPGEQYIPIEVIDRCGSTVFEHRIVGVEAGQVELELTDLTALADIDFSGTAWATDTATLITDVVVTNESELAWAGPLWLAIGSDLHPGISLLDPAGTTEDGLPYIVLASEGSTVAPGESIEVATMRLSDPTRVPALFTPKLLGAQNNPPVFLTAPRVQVAVGVPWLYRPVASDPDGDTLSWELMRSPSGVSFDTTTGETVWIPTATNVGLHQLAIRVSDGRGGAATQVFTLLVAPTITNRPPVFISDPILSATVGLSYAYDAHAVDLDGDILTYSMVIGPPGALVDSSTGLVTWAAALPGFYDVVLEADDGNGAIATQQYQLAVGLPPPNGNPRVTTTPPVDAELNLPYIYQPLAIDPEGDPLTWSLIQSPPGMLADRNTGRVTWTPTLAEVGTHQVNLEVADDQGGAGRQNWLVVVTTGPPNLPPVFSSVPFTVGVVGTTYRYDAYAVDPEASIVSYSLVDGPPGLTLADPSRGIYEWTPQPGDGGSHPVIIRAVDPQGAGSNQSWAIEVRDGNLPPVVDPTGPDSAYAGAIWQFDVDATDPEADDLEYALIAGPSGMAIDPLTGLVFWIPNSSQLGGHSFTVRVTDSFQATTDATWNLTVVRDSIGPRAVLELLGDGCINTPQRVCVRASDDVGLLSRGLTVDGVFEQLDITGCATLVGFTPVSYDLVATARDVGGNQATDTGTLTLTTCP